MYIKNDGGIMKIECPCVDCITLGICKGIMSENFGIYTHLSKRCSIFKEFYQNRYFAPDDPEKLFIMRLFPQRSTSQRSTFHP